MAVLKQDFDRLHTELLEAVVACRADPGKHAVHSVRTGTRKLEALLRKALEDHPGASHLHKTARKAQRNLKRIRRAAGPVRDLDIHRQLAEELHGQALSAAETASRGSLSEDYKELDESLRKRRKRAARRLEKVLQKQELPLESALEDVAGSLAQLRAASAPPLKTASRWTHASSLPALDPSADSFEEELHGYRKRTKAARYIADLQKSSAEARELVQRLKKIQDSIGRWHDLLLLTEEAAGLLGKHATLTSIVRSQRDDALQAATLSVDHGGGNQTRRSPAGARGPA